MGNDELFEDFVDLLCRIQNCSRREKKRDTFKKHVALLNKELELGLKIDP